MNEFYFLQGIFQGWHKTALKMKTQRARLEEFIPYREKVQLQKCLQGWRKALRQSKNYRKRRDLFYKKMLIFNYKYILLKYFNRFKKYHNRFITKHFVMEQVKNHTSARLKQLQYTLFREFKLVISILKEEKYLTRRIHQISLRQSLQNWQRVQKARKVENLLYEKNQDLNDIEKWVVDRRNRRKMPITQITLLQEQTQITPKKEVPVSQNVIPPNEPDKIKQLELLNQYLQLKLMELDYLSKMTNKDIDQIRILKLEVKKTLGNINSLKQYIQSS